MTPEIIATLVILGGAFILFAMERLRVDLIALLVLLALGVFDLVDPAEAVSGFGSPPVITVCAVFILSAGLYRVGIAGLLGHQILRFAGRGQSRLIVAIMLSAGLLSFFMNTIGIVALMLPAIMDVARRTEVAPSKLLMPLTFGALLGGLTTLFATLTNLLASNALAKAGHEPFGIFDFAPVGVIVAFAGVVFMVLVGRHLLPNRDLEREASSQKKTFAESFDFREKTFVLRLPPHSLLAGRTLEQSCLGSVLGLHVVGVVRRGRTQLAPPPSFEFQSRDRLLIQGTADQLNELDGWRQLVVHEVPMGVDDWQASDITLAEFRVEPDSKFVGQTLTWIDFRQQFGLTVIAIRRGAQAVRSNLQNYLIKAGDSLAVHGPREALESIQQIQGLTEFRFVSHADLQQRYRLEERLFSIEVTDDSNLAGKTLGNSRLGSALGFAVLSISRTSQVKHHPDASELIQAGDHLLLVGKSEDLLLLRAVKDLELEEPDANEWDQLESENLGFLEVVVSPRCTLVGKTLRQLSFRDRYGLNVMGIWREGVAHSANLRDMALRLGDALLLYGPREKHKLLATDSDFIVLTEAVVEPPLSDKIPWAIVSMLVFLIPALMGWLDIHLAAIAGAVTMVLSRCLSMDEACKSIHLKSIILMAGMLPLGFAMKETGTAELLAEGMVKFVEPFGPLAVIGGMFVLTSVGCSAIPAAAFVVLISPIALEIASDLLISPHAIMMAIAMAAASSFNSPIAHPANVMIMGPGGYRFRDYLRVGVPLTLVVLVIVLLVLPVFWPLKV